MVPADPSDALVTLDAEDAFYTQELFRDTAAGVQDGRVHLFPGWGHVRAATSTATAHLTLGFRLAGVPSRGRTP